MKPWRLLGRTDAPDGGQLSLYEHDGEYVLRVGGRELMSTRRTASEQRLATLGCAGLGDRAGARVLIGGLGLGFTLRAALEVLPHDAEVVVAELLPAVVEWNREPSYALASQALADPRTRVVVDDVFKVLAQGKAVYDAVLLDADNGTTAMMTPGNKALYADKGLDAVHAALRPGGSVTYWSAEADPRFAKALRRAGFEVSTERVRAYATGGPYHELIVGRRVERRPPPPAGLGRPVRPPAARPTAAPFAGRRGR